MSVLATRTPRITFTLENHTQTTYILQKTIKKLLLKSGLKKQFCTFLDVLQVPTQLMSWVTNVSDLYYKITATPVSVA